MTSTLLPRVAKMLATRTPTVVAKRNAWVFERPNKPHYVPPKHKIANTQEEIDANAKKQEAARNRPAKILTYNPLEEDQPDEPVKVILLHNTEDYGMKGQVVVVDNSRNVRDNLLLPGMAVYATKENMEKYKDILIPEENLQFSSVYVRSILPELRRKVVPVTVNSYGEWTLEARHIRACLRRIQVNVPEDCIEMPEEKISGPNMENEGKEFLITITINDCEKVPMRCRLHHVDAPKTVGWMHVFNEPVLSIQGDDLFKVPRNKIGAKALEVHQDNVAEPYKEWRRKRDEQLKAS